MPESAKLMLNDSFHCNRTYNVALVCRIHGGVKDFGFNPWKHVLNDDVVKKFVLFSVISVEHLIGFGIKA